LAASVTATFHRFKHLKINIMTDYLPHSNLPVIDFDFPKQKNDELENHINNLKLSDVDSDLKFKSTLQTIKNRFLLKTVSFDDPKIIDHYQTEKDFPSSYENPWGGKRKIFVIKVEIKFTGDTELFQYKPNGYNYGGNEDPFIYQPSGNKILLEIETFNIDDKQKIFSDVQGKMGLTYKFIDSNNKFIEKWNSSIDSVLENKLHSHKERLEKLYK
jgi:hypothetical protein